MTGETDLKKLIREMRPELNQGEYVFCTLDAKEYPSDLEPIAWFQRERVLRSFYPKRKPMYLVYPIPS